MKQKEIKAFEQALNTAWKGYVDRGAATVDALEDNTQELAFAKGFKAGYGQYEQGYKDAIGKACEWLNDNLPLYWGQVNADNTDRFVRIFKKAMEE